MSNTLYQFTVPLFRRGFAVLSSYLVFAQQYVGTDGLTEGAILNARLAPDMLPFSAQIQRASDKAKNGVARLAQLEAPSFSDTEKSFSELEQRLARTIAFVSSVPESQFDGAYSANGCAYAAPEIERLVRHHLWVHSIDSPAMASTAARGMFAWIPLVDSACEEELRDAEHRTA